VFETDKLLDELGPLGWFGLRATSSATAKSPGYFSTSFEYSRLQQTVVVADIVGKSRRRSLL